LGSTLASCTSVAWGAASGKPARPRDPSMIRIGVDTGGTFTDFVLRDDDRSPSTRCVRRPTIRRGRSSRGWPNSACRSRADIVHGSTVATNAVLERRGAKVALVARRDSRDVLRIGRQTRESCTTSSSPTGARWGRRPRGRHSRACREPRFSVEPLDDVALDGAAARRVARRAAPRPLAVCCLHSPNINPSHERAVTGAAGAPGLRRVGVTPGAAGVSRVRAVEHHGRQRLRHRRSWPSTSGDSSSGSVVRACASCSRTAGRSRPAGRARPRRPDDSLRPGSGRRLVHRRWPRRRAYPRAIAFDMGGTSTDVTADRWRHWGDARVHGGRLPGQASRHRHPHGGRAEGGRSPSSIQEARSGSAPAAQVPSLARPATTRRRTDGDRRQPAASGGSSPATFSVAHGARCRFGARSVALTFGARPRSRRTGPGRWHRSGSQREHGARHQGRLGAARSRPRREFALLAFGGAGGMPRVRPGRVARHGHVIVPLHAGCCRRWHAAGGRHKD